MLKKIKLAAVNSVVSLNDAKLHLRVDHSDDDALILWLIEAAKEQVENTTWTTLLRTTYTAYFNRFSSVMVLDDYPITEITSIKYYNSEGVLTTVDQSTYFTDLISTPSIIIFKDGTPTTQHLRPNAVEIEYKAGYINTNAIPSSLKSAILLMIGHWYEHREDIVIGSTTTEVPISSKSLMNNFRKNRFTA